MRRKKLIDTARPIEELGGALCYSTAEFCRSASISEEMFYKLRRTGRGPKIFKLGARTMISVEAARRWIEEREREAE